MTVFYVHRKADGTIDAAMGRARPGYAEEVLDDSAPELAAFLHPPEPEPTLTVESLAAALEKKGVLNKAEIDAERGKK